MAYSLEKMHEPKPYGKRRAGHTVDALVDAIGKIMVLQNERIPFVVKYIDRVRNKLPEFCRLCREHFKETPVSYSQYEYGLKGYTSRIEFISSDLYETRKREMFHPNIQASYDLD